jgi:DNA-binding MarR family transcriptional regulator
MSESALAAVDTSALAADLALIVGRLKRRLREQASIGDFTPSQIAVVLRLERDGPATVTALAQAEGVRSQSMGATVAALKALGAVIGTPDPNDGRQTVLSLSDSFAAAVKAGRAARHDWLRHALESRFSAREQGQLATTVPLLKRLVDG